MLTAKEISLGDNILWDEVIGKSDTATFFQSKEWLKLWVKHFGGKVKIIGVFEEDRLVGIAPFEIRDDKLNFLGVNPVLGEGLVSDFGDVIAISGREQEVWEAVLRNKPNSKFELNFIKEDSPSFKILQELGGKVEVVDVAPFIDLPKTWDEYLSGLDRHDRHELRRKIRRAEEEGVVLSEYGGDNKEINTFFQLMADSNEQKRDFLTEEMKNFFKDVITIFWGKKLLNYSLLKLKEKTIAATLTFLFKGEVLLYNSGLNPNYFHLSPGLILKANLIKNAIENGKKRFDFLRGGERYKYDLGGKERKLYKIII